MPDSTRIEYFAQELNSWDFSSDADQHELHNQYRDLIASDSSSLARVRIEGHFTASALLVDPERAQVLLVMHPKVKRWLQMGGHIETIDLSFRQAAVRESIEESGYRDIDVLQVPSRLDRHDVPCKSSSGEAIRSVHWDVQFLALVDSGPHNQREITEGAATKWWNLDASVPGLDRSVEQLMRSARQFLDEGFITPMSGAVKHISWQNSDGTGHGHHK
jgi:8-oxo-dGTP pyrophosphatase MutT (NUDIX family)